jgi:hypothetical protein
VDISALAKIYVDVIEPSFKFIALLFIIMLLFQFIGLMTDSKKKSEMVGSAFSFIIKIIKGALVYTGHAIWWLTKVSLKIMTVIFASIRDFFTSKI